MDMGGFRIATIRGIPIRIHFTFLLVLPLLAFAFATAFRRAAVVAGVPPERLVGSPWLWGLGVALALFASVLVHELAHSLYALRKGGRVRDITLLLIGGVSQLTEPPKEAKDEAVMAFVGPLLSLLLGGGFLALHALADEASFNLRFALFYLGSLNLFLGAFNLLPAFPMDGGRVLRALLVGRVGFVRATQIAAQVGKVFAVLFGVFGFLSGNMLLVLIAFFVYVGARGESQSAVVKELLGRLRVRDVMSTAVGSLPASATVHEAAERMLAERELAFAAEEDGRTVGLVTLDAIQAVPPDRRGQLPVRALAAETPPLSPDDDAAKALRLLTQGAAPQLAVTVGGRLVGTIGREDMLRALKLAELEATQHREAPWTGRRRELPA